ncbi:MAG: 3'-5' DNA helicase, partial [Chaenotheca gracillima]
MLSGDEASESATASGLPSRPAQGGYSEADIARELEDLPSDAFASSLSSSPEPVTSVARPAPSRVVGGGGPAGFRQTTLFGNAVPQASPPRSSRPPAKNEPPTHHELNPDALQTWVYPTNLGSIRDYQFNIVQKGLFHNLLVALPTGL